VNRFAHIPDLFREIKRRSTKISETAIFCCTLILCFAFAAPAFAADSVIVTVTLDKSRIDVGETTKLHIWGAIAQTIVADSDRIFSWYVDGLNSAPDIAAPAWAGLLMPVSDSPGGTASSASRGTVVEADCLGIRNTFLTKAGAGKQTPVELFQVDVKGLRNGTATFSCGPGTSTPAVLYDFQVARLGGGLPFTGGNYDTASITLRVGPELPPAPVITAQPTNKTVTVGQPIAFTVAVTGESLAYQWQLNGTNITGATGASYSITNVRTNDAGSYTVIVSNPGGSTPSSPGTLTVNRLAQSISFPAIPAKTFGDAPFLLIANASSSLPVTFMVLSGPARVEGSLLALLGVGNVIVRATQEGNPTYNEVFVDQTFTVNAGLLPLISIDNVNLTEGNAGTTNAVFTVRLSKASAQVVTVDYATTNGTAVAGSDYNVSFGRLTFAPGDLSQEIKVGVLGDNLNEAAETFQVLLSNPVNAGLGTRQGTGTINNDDALPTISVSDAGVAEPGTGTADALFTVFLSAPSGQIVKINYATVDGTAVAGSDYTAATGALTFEPGAISKTVVVKVLADTLNEGTEQFKVKLSAAQGATLADDEGIGTISSIGEVLPVLSISDASLTEADSGTLDATFTVSLSAKSGQMVTVKYVMADVTAQAGSDYTAVSNGALTFAAGITSQTITIKVLGDTLPEGTESFAVNLLEAVNASIGKGQGIGTINDNDPAPSLSIDNVTVLENNSGTTNAVFTVRLSKASGQMVTVNYATTNGTAVAGSDYNVSFGRLTFAPGDLSQEITVGVLGDKLNEAAETFQVILSNPGNASIAAGQGTGTINNDDVLPAISISDAAVLEGNSGTSAAIFIVSLSELSGQNVQVHYTTTNGTAVAGADYAAISGSLSFPPGTLNQTVSVQVVGDTATEAMETFFLDLSAAQNATIARLRGSASLINDDVVSATLTAVNDQALAGADASRVIPIADLLSNDSGASPLRIISLGTSNTKGKVHDNGNGTLTYDPDGKFALLKRNETAADVFQYTVQDSAGATASAEVAVTIIWTSRPVIERIGLRAGGSVILKVSGLPGVQYQLQAKQELSPAAWRDVGSSQVGPDRTFEITDTNQSSKSFYRIIVRD
jgi:hypothetical protein